MLIIAKPEVLTGQLRKTVDDVGNRTYTEICIQQISVFNVPDINFFGGVGGGLWWCDVAMLQTVFSRMCCSRPELVYSRSKLISLNSFSTAELEFQSASLKQAVALFSGSPLLYPLNFMANYPYFNGCHRIKKVSIF